MPGRRAGRAQHVDRFARRASRSSWPLASRATRALPQDAPPSSSTSVPGIAARSPSSPAETYVGRCADVRSEQRVGIGDPGEHEQAVEPGRVGALDVGVQPVADDQRMPSAARPRPPRRGSPAPACPPRGPACARMRATARARTTRCPVRLLDSSAVSGRGWWRPRRHRAAARTHPQREAATPGRGTSPGRRRPAGRRPPPVGAHRDHGLADPGSADDQDVRANAGLLDGQSSGGLCAGEHVRRVASTPMAARSSTSSSGVRLALLVTYTCIQPVLRRRAPQRIHHAGQDRACAVHRPVEVQQGPVIEVGERLFRAAQRHASIPWPPLASSRARSVARACRSASAYGARSGRIAAASARCSAAATNSPSRLSARPRPKSA